MSEGTRKFKMQINPYLPNCQRCPWIEWCSKLSFRAMNPKGESMKVCPIWWMLMEKLQEKGLIKKAPLVPPTVPISNEEARAIMDALRRQKLQKMGVA